MSVVLCFVLSAIFSQTQTADTKQAPPAKTVAVNSTPATDAAAEEIKERRARARSLLVALSSDARTFHDQTLRARSLARIADALWKIDPEQGRLMFRKAWEAAEVADQESDQKL
jgi:ABC-type Zn uptake system ZnuABC Zn-binding protein ZnuA